MSTTVPPHHRQPAPTRGKTFWVGSYLHCHWQFFSECPLKMYPYVLRKYLHMRCYRRNVQITNNLEAFVVCYSKNYFDLKVVMPIHSYNYFLGVKRVKSGQAALLCQSQITWNRMWNLHSKCGKLPPERVSRTTSKITTNVKYLCC